MMRECNGWGTHLPLLLAAVAKTDGPILEMGCGDASTPILHELCKSNGRTLTSLENNKKWAERFDYFNIFPFHDVLLVENWDTIIVTIQYWSVVLIDHHPGQRRIVDIERLKDKAKFLVLHDTDYKHYNYDKIWPLFKYRFEDKSRKPWTAVVSNVESLF